MTGPTRSFSAGTTPSASLGETAPPTLPPSRRPRRGPPVANAVHCPSWAAAVLWQPGPQEPLLASGRGNQFDLPVVWDSEVADLIGGDEGIRTLDLLSAIQALFRAELRPHRVRSGHSTGNRWGMGNGSRDTGVRGGDTGDGSRKTGHGSPEGAARDDLPDSAGSATSRTIASLLSPVSRVPSPPISLSPAASPAKSAPPPPE